MENKKAKKIFVKRAVSLIIACAFIFSCAAATTSCETQQGKTAMSLTYGGNTTAISSNIYSYYLSYTKSMVLYNSMAQMYNMMGMDAPDPGAMDDIPEFWAEIARDDGATYADATKEQAESTLKQLLAIAAYCGEHKLELPKETVNDIDLWVKDLIDNLYNRSKSNFNSKLLRFNIDDTILKEIKKLESLTGVFSKYLFDADTGARPISDDMINQIYEQTCVRVKHILIPYNPGTYDVDGNPEAYTEEELAAVYERIDDLYERINNGEDFDSLLSESADGMPSEGYTISMETGFVQEFKDAAFGLKVGETGKAESEYGMHIIKRYELLPADQSFDITANMSWAGSIYRQVQIVIMGDELTPYIDMIEINKAETDAFDVTTSALMFDCPELLS